MFALFKKKILSFLPLEHQADSISNNHDKIIEVIKSLLNNDICIVFDLGAHHGSYSKAINDRVDDVQIHSFEPFPKAFSILEQKLAAPNYHLYPIALSNINGSAVFYINKLDETNSLLPSAITNSPIDFLTFNEKTIEVQVRTIDNICKQENISRIDVLKIDAQGNTLNILIGAVELLQLKKIKVIQCEVEFLEVYISQSLFHHTTTFLERYGYSLYSLYNVHYDVNQRISWADALYYLND